MGEKPLYCTVKDHRMLREGGYSSCSKCGGSTTDFFRMKLLEKDCDHKWTVARMDKCHIAEGHGKNKKSMIVGVPVYKCRKCGIEK